MCHQIRYHHLVIFILKKPDDILNHQIANLVNRDKPLIIFMALVTGVQRGLHQPVNRPVTLGQQFSRGLANLPDTKSENHTFQFRRLALVNSRDEVCC